MDGRWIASTPNQDLRPVGTPGQRDHGLLVQVLSQHLSAGHAALFAEPVPNPDGRTTDWYSALDGDPEPLDALPPAARAEAEQRLRQRHDEIQALAARLAQARDSDSAQKAAMLQAALEIPDPGFIRVLGGQPVLLAWAHLKDYPDAPRGVLGSWIQARRAPPPATPPSPPPAAAADPDTFVPVPVPVERRWVAPAGLLWLLFALLAAAIGYLMLVACGIGWPGWLARCPLPTAVAANDGLVRELERQRQLEHEIAQLQRQLAGAAADCQTQPPIEPTATPPETRAEIPPAPPPECAASEIDRRREEAGGKIGQVTVSLGWDGPADLDLGILCPDGTPIQFNNAAGCGARLDVDMNAGSRSSMTPIENVFWPSKPSTGAYQVYVTLFDRRGDRRPAIPFRVELDVLGDRQQVDGSAEQVRRPMLATGFEITDAPPPEPPACPDQGAATEPE